MGIEQKQVTRRGAVALALSAGLGLTGAHGVADSWRGTIDSALGTTSTEQTADDKFTPSIASTDDLVKAHEDLGRRVGQEGHAPGHGLDVSLPGWQDGLFDHHGGRRRPCLGA